MPSPRFTLFDTPIGRCAIVWGSHGVVGVQLPESSERATCARVARRFPGAAAGAPPDEVRRAMDEIGALLAGRPNGVASIPLDMTAVAPFHRRVYEAARTIPSGTTLSYGALAARAGAPGAARAVGQALGRNPFALIVPCHRVLAAGGRTGGFSANGGAATKLRLLDLERPASKGDGGHGFDARTAAGHLRAADPALGRLIDAVGPLALELRRTSSLFGALVEAIVHQQLTAAAAATIHARLRRLCPRPAHGPTADGLLRLSDARLRAAGLSGAKRRALRELARAARAGRIPTLAAARDMDDGTIVERLVAVRGIGRWTAEMLLIFRLGRPDVLPTTDYGVRKGFALAFGTRALPAPADVARRGERWRPYRTAASWYLWRAAERGR